MKVELLRLTERPLNLISEAYRICYASAPKDDPEEENKFIKACIRNQHTSPLEHAAATFLISGISRPCSQQIERHRIASYTQESQRYVNAENAKFILPASIANNASRFSVYDELLRRATATYNLLIFSGVKKEDARFVLPQAVTTKMMMSINFRALRNFLNLRLDVHAQWEVRQVAEAMVAELNKISPELVDTIFGDILNVKGSVEDKR